MEKGNVSVTMIKTANDIKKFGFHIVKNKNYVSFSKTKDVPLSLYTSTRNL
jgi:hypothetical protein